MAPTLLPKLPILELVCIPAYPFTSPLTHPVLKALPEDLVFKQGIRGQCLPCRAPEVWRGLGIEHPSDV